MTPEKTLEHAFSIVQAYAPEHFDHFKKHPEHFGHTSVLSDPVLMACADLITDARAQLDKKAGRGGALKAAKNIIKTVGSSITKDDIRGGWTDAAGRFCLCDGYRAVRLNEPLHDIPEAVGLDLDHIFQSAANCDIPLDLPSVADIRAEIQAQKTVHGCKRPLWDFGEGLPQVDASFLLDMLALLPECSAYIGTYRPEINPIYFKSPSGDGLLLPVRKSK